ncbi:MAG: TetR/AcrR family transcriptional regulator, partial [Thaumarchaeota archaeon]|nr:TetR/AcrR family transcriptional regulator [Nitrososphaerota archaeon]
PRTEQANLLIREGQQRKILDAARKVFARKGGAATMAEVAAEADVSQGLAYRYFPSKEAILTTLVKQTAESGGGPALRIKEISGTPGKRLEILVSYIVEDRRERPEFYQFLYQVLADETMPDEFRRLVRRNGRVIQDTMRQLITEGQARGEIAKDDPDQLLAALMAIIDGLRSTALLDPKDAKEHFPDTKIILRMLKPDVKK